MSQQTKSAILAWCVTFCASLLTVLTQVQTNGGGIWAIDPLAVLIAAIAAFVAVGKDVQSQRSFPNDRRSVPREERKDEWEEHG